MNKNLKHLKFTYNLFIVFTLLFSSFVCDAQTNGLAVDMQYDKRIQDERYHNQQMKAAYVQRYKSLQDKYTYALGLNAIKDSPKKLPSTGTFDGLLTDGGSVYDFVTVGVENNRVKYIKSSKGETLFPTTSTDVVNFRSIITTKVGYSYELIFTYLFD